MKQLGKLVGSSIRGSVLRQLNGTKDLGSQAALRKVFGKEHSQACGKVVCLRTGALRARALNL